MVEFIIILVLVLVFFSQQFVEVCANDLADRFNSSLDRIRKKMKQPKIKLDLMGLISILGTKSAVKSLTFSFMNDASSVTGHVGPGSLSIATALLQMTGFRAAQLLSLTSGEEAINMTCPQGLRYIGLKSRTQCPVLNTVGASIVRENKQLWIRHKDMKPVGRDAGRHVEVLVLSISKKYIGTKAQVLLKGKALDFVFLGWMPLLLTLGVVGVAFASGEWFVGALIGLGTLAITLSVAALRFFFVFRYAEIKVAEGAPEGDCLIVDDTDDAETLHIVIGTEASIQALFQRALKQDQVILGRMGLLLVGMMLYTYSIASALWLPNVSIYGQILFTAANVVGLLIDMIKGSRNGKLGLARKAREQFEMALRERVVFGNRTAAVAFVAKFAEDCSVLKTFKLLPTEGPVWEKWWELLHHYKHSRIEDVIVNEDAFGNKEADALLQRLLKDMICGLSYKTECSVDV